MNLKGTFKYAIALTTEATCIEFYLRIAKISITEVVKGVSTMLWHYFNLLSN